MTLVDTHCHLNDRRAFPDPVQVVDEALSQGVARLVVVGVDTESSERAVDLADRFDPIYAVVGWHPNSASEFNPSEMKRIEGLLGHPKVVALGEIGLDYYRDHASREDQERCLAAQLDLAKSLRAPVVFHCREAYPDLLDRLAGWVGGSLLFHCFAGNVHELGRASLLDAYFGVDGPITYKNSDSLRAVVQKMPLDRIVLETDAPWMAPVPYRGQNNKPAWLPLINRALADALGQSESAMAKTSTANAARFFQWGD